MKRTRYWTPLPMVLALFTALTMAACSSSDGPGTRLFTVSLTNTSASQPLSPPALVTHDGSYVAWTVGSAATNGLERLAEGGDPAAFLVEAGSSSGVGITASGTGILLPGQTEIISLTLSPADGRKLAVATMLVNTNDAFTGMTDLDLSGLSTGEEVVYWPSIWDAGTEGNTETAASVPGPAGGGEGYNADRSGDRDFVAVHAGVVTADDGLTTSALDESHRFAGPVMLVKVVREE